MRIGTAGWSISREAAAAFPGEGRHLERYGRVLGCAEINSSFHRSHRVEVYQRWAAQTPPGFRFSVKLPRSISHDARHITAAHIRLHDDAPLAPFVVDARWALGLAPPVARHRERSLSVRCRPCVLWS